MKRFNGLSAPPTSKLYKFAVTLVVANFVFWYVIKIGTISVRLTDLRGHITEGQKNRKC